MKFLHTADLHIGKKLHGYDLITDQRVILQQILQIAKEQQVDALVIAGDLYDRSVPAVEAVSVLDDFLKEVNLTEQFPILAISGNHDSAQRLATGTPWYQMTQFHLHTTMASVFEPVVIGDTQFFLLPYFEPIEARLHFEDDSLTTIQEAMEQVIAKCLTLFDPTKKHVLVTHFFIAGSLRTESETPVEVGGLNSVPIELLKDFDYVALGHLHSKTAIKEGPVRYSGSPLKFSLSEVNDDKGVWIIDSQTMVPEFHPLTPLREVRQLEASFAELTDPDFYQTIHREDFWQFLLTDRAIIPNMMNQLRAIYPHLLSIERINGREAQVLKTFKKRTEHPQTVIANFFEEITGDALTPQQVNWLETGLALANDTEKRDAE